MYLLFKWLTLLLNKGMKIAVPKGSDNYQKYKETIPSLTLMSPFSTEAWNSVLGTKTASCLGPKNGARDFSAARCIFRFYGYQMSPTLACRNLIKRCWNTEENISSLSPFLLKNEKDSSRTIAKPSPRLLSYLRSYYSLGTKPNSTISFLRWRGS